jgi:hypothetical protein
MSPSSLFSVVRERMLGRVLEVAESDDLVDEADEDAVSTAIREVIEAATPEFAEQLIRSAPKALRKAARSERGFERRNRRRWRPAFDRIDLCWMIAQEIGAEFNREHRPAAVASDDYVFEALTRLHGRGLLVASEAIHLMKGGYAEGALSRWRTLHEILVVAMFIKEHGDAIAERYLQSAHFRSLEAAEQLNKFAERANLQPFTQEEVDEFKRRCAEIAAVMGAEMYSEYGWARPALPPRSDKWRPRFDDIEASLELDHWRPRYKWASQHSHAGHRHNHAQLGLVEAEQDMILVGPSNSGMVDPLQLTAMHVWSLTTTLLLTRESIEALILINVLQYIMDDVAPLAIDAERSSAEKYRRRHRSGAEKNDV